MDLSTDLNECAQGLVRHSDSEATMGNNGVSFLAAADEREH